MTEAYDKLRDQFKELSLPDRVSFIAEATLMTGQSAVVDGINLAGSAFESIGSTVENLAKSTGLTDGSDNVVKQTVERVAITVKDAGKASSTVFKDVAKSVDDATGGISKGVGAVTSKASDVVQNVTDSIQKSASAVTSPKSGQKK